MPIGLDSGMDQRRGVIGAVPSRRDGCGTASIFWPRTTTPMVLVTNRREHAPAVYGKIRVLAAGERLPPALPDRAGGQRRLLAAYLDRPLFPENFSAAECLDAGADASLDDWITFYQGGTRLVEYLDHVGYNGLMLGRAGRRQHDLSQPAPGAHAALRHRRASSPPPRIRSARTCWRCCCGCSTARACN